MGSDSAYGEPFYGDAPTLAVAVRDAEEARAKLAAYCRRRLDDDADNSGLPALQEVVPALDAALRRLLAALPAGGEAKGKTLSEIDLGALPVHFVGGLPRGRIFMHPDTPKTGVRDPGPRRSHRSRCRFPKSPRPSPRRGRMNSIEIRTGSCTSASLRSPRLPPPSNRQAMLVGCHPGSRRRRRRCGSSSARVDH